MRDVMEQYGKAVLCALVAVFLFAILFTSLKAGEDKGLIAVLGTKAESPGVDYSLYKDGEKSALVMERGRPEICFAGGELMTGCEYSAGELFAAKDAEGNPAEIKIIKILDKTGQEIEVAGGNLQFESQGSYRILVKAIDSYCAVTENEFLVPVRRR